jgi:hypothetical protein
VYEDSKRVGQSVATRQIPVSELLARHRSEHSLRLQRQVPAPSANEKTDVIPVITNDYDEFVEEFEGTDVQTQRINLKDTPSGEIYIRELLAREGKLPREARRKQLPKIAAAAAGVAALCGAVTASVIHIQSADDSKSLGAGAPGVPLTRVDSGGPRGQDQDAPLSASQNGTVLIPPTASSTANQPEDKGPRVAPYVSATPKPAKQAPSPTTAPAPPTAGSRQLAPDTSTPPPSTSTTTSPGTPPSDGNKASATTTPPSSVTSSPTSTTDTGVLDGLLDPITGLLFG